MKRILIAGDRLQLRRAEEADLTYILQLQQKSENRPHIVPYGEEAQLSALKKNGNTMNLVVEEKADATPVGYLFLDRLKDPFGEVEWTHVIIDKKGVGYGRETLKLLKKWSFGVKKYHRAYIDCKEENERALHLYESEGLVREGVKREYLFYDGKYENLVLLGILEREYAARVSAGLEL